MYNLIIYITQRKKFTGEDLNMISHMYFQLITSETVWKQFTVFLNLLNDSHSLIFTCISYKSYTYTCYETNKGEKETSLRKLYLWHWMLTGNVCGHGLPKICKTIST